VQNFRDLIVWRKSHGLVLEIYKKTASFPREEMYALTSQVKRASTSIPANIAEGCGRNSGPELAQFLQTAMGSASELEYHLLLARDLGYIDSGVHEAMEKEVTGIKRMLASLIGKLRGRSSSVAVMD